MALVEEVSILSGVLEQSKGHDPPADQYGVVLAALGPVAAAGADARPASSAPQWFCRVATLSSV